MKISTLLLYGIVACASQGVCMAETAPASQLPYTKAGLPFNAATLSPAEGLLLSEDFSKFTAGTPDNPDTKDISDETGKIPAELTNVEGWQSAGVTQAGGTAFVGEYTYTTSTGMQKTSTGYLRTPLLDLSVQGGVSTITFRARLLDPDADEDKLNVAVFTDGYKNSNTSVAVGLTPEWKEYKVFLSKGTFNGFYQFTSDKAKWEIDDVEITTGGLMAPIPTGATAYTKGGTSFVANWKPVDGATAYYVSVAHYQTEDSKGEVVIDRENLKTESTSLEITGLTGGTGGTSITYYYSVYAEDAEGNVSAPCEWTKVREELGVPEATGADGLTRDQYFANWDTVANASGYEVANVLEYHADKDGEYSLLNTDFEDITAGKFKKPEQYDGSDLDGYVERAGWSCDEIYFVNGYLGLNNTYYSQYPNIFKPAFVESPAFDFSTNGGKATVTFTALAADGIKGGTTVPAEGTPKLLVRFMALGNDETYEIPVEASAQEVTVETEAKEYKVELENAPANGKARVYIQAVGDYTGAIYLDKLKLSRDYKAGETVEVELATEKVTDEEQKTCRFNLVEENEGEYQAYKVRAYAYDDVTGKAYYSGWSPLSYVNRQPTAIANKPSATAFAPKAFASDGGIKVFNPSRQPVSICNASGMTVFTDHSGQSEINAPVSQKGLYIVKIGQKAVKLMK